VIYLYAIADADAPLPDCLGLEDAPVELFRAGALAGVCSRHERSSVDPEPAALWRHDQVVEAVMSSSAVLPARFGTTFGELDALRAALERDEQRLTAALEGVRGCVELAVRVTLPARATASPRSGQEYVHGELDRRRERRAAADRMLVPLSAHAVRSRTGGAEQGDLTASYLVRADAVEGFTEQVKVLARDHSELALSCTGPWPPYSFVGAEDE
jgi:hypothetical protein